MKKIYICRVIIKALAVPLITLFSLNKFNLFSTISAIPVDYQFEVGLTIYFSIFEAIAQIIEQLIDESRTTITFTFYKVPEEENIKSNPTIICSDDNNGVAYLSCHIALAGNIKKLRKAELCMTLPEWLSTQVDSNNKVLSKQDNTLIWKFTSLIPSSGTKYQKADCTQKIPFIRNEPKRAQIHAMKNG